MEMPIVPISPTSDFSLQNIPFGIISSNSQIGKRPATAIGDYAVDLKILANAGAFKCCKEFASVAVAETLNPFMALGRTCWREARATLQAIFSGTDPFLKSNAALRGHALMPLEKVVLWMPIQIGDYTDFYASKEHATNVGTLFRGKENALMPNWVHIPVGYHGRASSVVVSGTPIKRPCGMVLDAATKKPVFSVSKKLDIELEMACIIGVGNILGDRIPIEKADEHIFGVVLMNDWSARDIQGYEYVPLGPFLGKNFGTTISPWVVTLDALECAQTAVPIQDPAPAEYLSSPTPDKDAYDISLTVNLSPPNGSETVICKSNLKHMYWSFKQQVAHHTINGCNLQTGDLLGTGTLSGPTKESWASLLEKSWNGRDPIPLEGGSSRTFLEDGDTISISGYAESFNQDGSSSKGRVGFGECTGSIVSAGFSTMTLK